METNRSTESGFQDIAKSILCLVGRLQDARSVNPAHAVGLMALIASRYRQAVIETPEHYLIADLPGNAALWKAMAANGHVDENLYARLKATVSRAIQSVFPDIARYAEGVDAALLSASKLRREYDILTAEIQFAVDTGKVARHEDAPLYGLREAILTGGVSARRLAPLAFEALHDLVFSHTLSDEDGADFIEHSIEDATESLITAENAFGVTGKVASAAGVTRKNLDMFWSGAERSPCLARAA